MKTEEHTIKSCTYKGEEYLVRDDGYIMRKKRPNGRKRKYDNYWTLGYKNPQNGYLYIGQHRVHIIVATAFLGPKDSKVYVVDHKDSNRCNNRIENLRWVTRIENILLNPYTASKVKYLCGGDISKFIEDPTNLRNLAKPIPDISWMRPVSKEEANNTLNNTMKLTLKNQLKTNDTYKEDKKILQQMYFGTNDIVEILHPEKRKPAEWMYEETTPIHPMQIDQEAIKAVYPENVLQIHWKTPSTFPCCPTSETATLSDYQKNLTKGTTFVSNELYSSTVYDSQLINGDSILLVATRCKGIKNFAICKIYNTGNVFIHESKGTYFSECGMLKQFTVLQGKQWNGPDSIDDYC